MVFGRALEVAGELVGMSDLMTTKEAALELGVSTAQLTRLTLDGEIPSINVGRGKKRPARRYLPTDIEHFLEQRRTVACPSIGEKARPRSRSTSGSKVIDFRETLEKLRSAKRELQKA
jgi:excisionase family DNA binding protein